MLFYNDYDCDVGSKKLEAILTTPVTTTTTAICTTPALDWTYTYPAEWTTVNAGCGTGIARKRTEVESCPAHAVCDCANKRTPQTETEVQQTCCEPRGAVSNILFDYTICVCKASSPLCAGDGCTEITYNNQDNDEVTYWQEGKCASCKCTACPVVKYSYAWTRWKSKTSGVTCGDQDIRDPIETCDAPHACTCTGQVAPTQETRNQQPCTCSDVGGGCHNSNTFNCGGTYDDSVVCVESENRCCVGDSIRATKTATTTTSATTTSKTLTTTSTAITTTTTATTTTASTTTGTTLTTAIKSTKATATTVSYNHDEAIGTHVDNGSDDNNTAAAAAAGPTQTNTSTKSNNTTHTRERQQEQEQEGEQQQQQVQGNDRKPLSTGLAAGIGISAILAIAVIGVAIAMQKHRSNDNDENDDDDNNNVQAFETVEVVQNPVFDRHRAVDTRGNADSTPVAEGVGGAVGTAEYLEPDCVQPAVYEGLKKTQQLVAAGVLVLDLDGYVVDEEIATTAASSSSVVYATALDNDDVVDPNRKPTVVYAIPVEMEDTLLKTGSGGRSNKSRVVPPTRNGGAVATPMNGSAVLAARNATAVDSKNVADSGLII